MGVDAGVGVGYGLLESIPFLVHGVQYRALSRPVLVACHCCLTLSLRTRFLCGLGLLPLI